MNAWSQVDQIAAEALMHLEDRLVITSLAAKDKTADFNATSSGYKVGSTVRIKLRPDYAATEFTTGPVVAQGIRESERSLTIEKLFDVSVELTAKEKALDFENFIDQVVKPATYRLAEACETYVGTKILQAQGLYISDEIFADAADMALVKKYSTFQQLNPEGRYCIMNDTLEARLLGKTFFGTWNSRGSDGQRILREGELGKTMGMEFYSSLQFPTWVHTPGLGVAQTNNASGVNNRVGASVLTVDSVNLSSNTIKAGDRITVAGMRRPMKVSTLANGAATTQILLTDPISEIVPDDAAVTVVGATRSNVNLVGAVFDTDSLCVAMPRLDTPGDKLSYVLSNNGFSIRVVVGYDQAYKKEMMSLDCLIGAAAYDPRRITLLGEY